MSSLDNLTSKILNDAKEKAKDIVAEAEKTAQEKYDREMRKIEAKKTSLIENAARDRDLTAERIRSSASLRARNEKLQAKQTVIDRVIGRLKDKLVNMSEDEYISYIRRNVDSQVLQNKKLIVKREYLGAVRNEFQQARISDEEFVTSGFIAEENGIQENYTFEVKLDFMRDELEVEISKFLFS